MTLKVKTSKSPSTLKVKTSKSPSTLKDKIIKFIENNEYNKAFQIIQSNKSFNINIYNKNNISLFELVINSNNIKIINLLFSRNVNLDILDIDGKTLLYQPIKFNNIQLLELILKYNNKSVGINILDLKDNYGSYSIHYCIKLNNFKALKLLIKYGSNIFYEDLDKNNILHLAGYSKNETIISFLINNYPELYTFNKHGESIFHIAIINNLSQKIINLLIDKIDFNKTSGDKNIVALVTAIIEDNHNIFNKLDDIDIDINIQDYIGNSILYYCIDNENFRYFEKIYNILDVKKYNFNSVNIYGKTILHHIFDNIKFLKFTINYNILHTFIKYTNLNLQDNDGNSTFFFICKFKLWNEYYSILEFKPINAFLQKKNNIKPIDFVDNKNYDNFYNLLTSAFFYYIQNKYQYNIDQKILTNCSKINDKCKQFVRNYIQTNSINTMPKKMTYCHNIVDNSISYVTFIGLQLDIYFGLLYLQNKFKKITTTLELQVFSQNNELIQFYKNNGIEKDFDYEIPNLEITWTFQKLILPIEFEKLLNVKNNIIIIPIAIILQQGSHSNILIINKINKTAVRFEPYGSEYPFKFNYNPNKLDSQLENIILKFYKDYQYIPPKSYLQQLSFQAFEISEDDKTKKIGDPGGFCAAWSLWFVENYLLNLDKADNLSELIKELILQIRIKNISFKNMIRTFASKIAKYRDKFLKKVNIDINQWNNGNLNQEKYDKVISFFKKL